METLVNLAKLAAENSLQLLDQIPKENIGDIRRQLKKSCLSIPSNVSEGLGRRSKSVKDCNRFFAIALGSTKEAITQFEILRKLRPFYTKYINDTLSFLTGIEHALEFELGVWVLPAEEKL